MKRKPVKDKIKIGKYLFTLENISLDITGSHWKLIRRDIAKKLSKNK